MMDINELIESLAFDLDLGPHGGGVIVAAIVGLVGLVAVLTAALVLR